MTAPAVSVVIPTYQRPDLLARCLSALRAQSAPISAFEVVVVDDGSGDRTPDVLRDAQQKMSNLAVISRERNSGPATCRNAGIKAAVGEVVLFLDDDIEASASLVDSHLRFHDGVADEMVGLLGRVHWAPELRVTSFMRWLDESDLQFGYDTWLREGPVEPPYAAFYTANLSVNRTLLERVGGFDERFPFPAYEDIELAWRLMEAGFRLEYRPGVAAFHTRSIDLATFRRRMAKVGESAELVAAAQPEFPVDHEPAERGHVRRRDLWRLRLVSPLARLRGNEGLLRRWYRAEIAAAYAAGRARAQEQAPSRGGGSVAGG